MRTVNAAQILEWSKDPRKAILCLDIREPASHKYLPIAGGIKIPYNKVRDNSKLLLKYREYTVVIIGINTANRCNRVHVAEVELGKMGFVEIFGLADGLLDGWIKPTQRKVALPGPTNEQKAF